MKLVFVSSTFKDMQYERDLLQTYAIPVLDDALREYGEKAYFGDLRWGVNTTDLDSDEGSKKVLQVCLDQIDNCKPYMIVLIGERYGWIPAQTLLDEACVLKGIEKIQDISVTELEIDYGALLEPECEGRIMFYFRDLDTTGMTEAELRDYQAESPLHAEKIEALKARIQKAYPNQIRHYTAKWDPVNQEVAGLEGFLQQVEKDLSDVLLRDLEAMNQIPWQERCIQSADRWFTEKAKYLVDAYEWVDRYCGSFTKNGQNCTGIYFVGPEGSGKTSRLVSYYAKSNCAYKLPFCFGLDKFSTDAEVLLQLLCYRMEQCLGLPHRECSYDNGGELLLEYLDQLAEAEQWISVYVDNGGESLISFLSFLERLCLDNWGPEKTLRLGDVLNFFAAMQVDIPYYPFFPISGVDTMGDLAPEKRARVLDGIIRSNHKEIAQEVQERILSKEQSGSAAYLRSVVKRLLILDSEDFAAIRAMGDGMENINKYMRSIVDNVSDDRYGVYMELIDEAKERIDTLFVNRLMSIFAYVPVGLTVEEVKAMYRHLGWAYSDLSFSLTVRMLEDVISYNLIEGYYKVKNPQIEELLRKFIPTIDLEKIAEYMLTVDSLREYAVSVAILCPDADFFYSIVKRSGVPSIQKQIRYLVERNQIERAVDIVMDVMGRGELPELRVLPELYDYSIEYRKNNPEHAMNHFHNLLSKKICDELGLTGRSVAEGAPPMDTRGKMLLLDLAIQSDILFAREILEDQAEVALQTVKIMLFHVQKIESRYYYQTLNGLIYTMLKCYQRIGSGQLYNKLIGDQWVLDWFDFETPYEKTVYWLKAAVAFAECLNMAGRTDERYDALLARIEEVAEDAYGIYNQYGEEFTEEDYIFFGSKSDDPSYFFGLGREVYPRSLQLLQAEAEDVSNCGYRVDEEDEDYDTLDVNSRYDLCKKTKLLFDFKQTKRAMQSHLSAIVSYLCMVEIGEEELEWLLDYFDMIASRNAYETYVQSQQAPELSNQVLKMWNWGVDLRCYVQVVVLYEALAQEKLQKAMEYGLEQLHRNEPMSLLILDFVKYAFVHENQEELDRVFREYKVLRSQYLGVDAQAIADMDYAFENMGYELD